LESAFRLNQDRGHHIPRPHWRTALIALARLPGAERGHACHDGIERRGLAEDHPRHRLVVAAQFPQHCIRRRQREAAGLGTCEVEIGAVEKHARMADAILAKRRIRQSGLAGVGFEQR
jgi:hypothetical protein